MAMSFDQGDGLLKEVWVGQARMETQIMVQRPSTDFFMKKLYTNKILGVRLEGLFWAGNKVGCCKQMVWVWTLGAWPLDASHYARPKAPILI
jgi:hypothetical protein